MKIFLSYGHDEYEKIAQRLKHDLELEGFNVWIDKDGIKGTADWENAIEEGILTSDWLILLMTEHSVRRPDGVCLDEVSYARFLGKNIAPIMIQDVKPPLCIARIQWIDMKNFMIPGKSFFDEESYLQKKNELLSVLKGVQILNNEGGQKTLQSCLNPLDNDVYSAHFKQDFCGRKNLINYYESWVKNSSRILWLVGDAGIGKTAFVANLSSTHSDIQAVHFCRYNDNERANPKRAIMSIAYYLATQINDYKNQLLELQDIGTLIEKSTERLFEYLIVEPLNRISYRGKPIVIAIDALDEATIDGRNELADVIAKHFDKTPCWVKLLVTSRKEALLERKLAKLHPVDFADPYFNNNDADIYEYFLVRLKDHVPIGKKGDYILKQLVKKSEGIFLYAKTIVDEITLGHLSVDNIDSFPDGLTGVYLDYFERIFEGNSTVSYKNDVRPVMEVLCATCAPLSETLLCDILELDEYDFSDICELICEMFPVRNGVLEPIHKSIVDWLVDSRRSGEFRVSVKRGHRKIANYFISKFNQNVITNYAAQYLCIHLLSDNRIEEFIELMSDTSFFNERVSIMGLDSAIREMLFEIKELNKKSPDSVESIFLSNTFIDLFSNYRKYLYNAGLYFHLKECGFDEFLNRNLDFGKKNNDTQIGIAYYYYITENFSRTITTVKQILSLNKTLTVDELAELHNLIALCYRKSVDFEKAQYHFETAISISNGTESYYDQSISLVNLGKIAYHELDWACAVNFHNKAIDYLMHELSTAENEDYRIALELFIAEYYRLKAECLIWNNDIKAVDENLENAEKIYNRINNRDRYYIRYQYTMAFRNILAGKYEEVFEECEILMNNATSKYDKSQILFYRGIAAFKIGRLDECIVCIEEAYKYGASIGAYLEMEEIIALASLLDDRGVELLHSKPYETNSIMQKWINHTVHFIRDELRSC